MKTTILVLLITGTALGQVRVDDHGTTAACGPDHDKFNVRTDKKQMPQGQVVPDKALVYFFQDDADLYVRPRPTFRLGVDGQWVGATQSNSYFYFNVDPGEHGLCAKEQMKMSLALGRPFRVGNRFKAEAGRTYYFRLKEALDRRFVTTWIVELDPVDADTGQVLMRRLSFSTFEHKR